MDIGAGPLEFVGSSNVNDDPVDVSDRIRETLGLVPGLGYGPRQVEDAQKYLQEPNRKCANICIQEHHGSKQPLPSIDPEEFRGFVLVDDYAPFVFVNGADVAGAQMFTLAHELAHVWMGESASFDLRGFGSQSRCQIGISMQ